MKKIIFSLVVLSFLLISGCSILAQDNILPSPGITPDSPFYFLKTWKETIQTFFTFGAENKAKQYLHLSKVRLAEYQIMVERGKTDIAQKTLDKYQKQLNQAIEKIQELRQKGEETKDLSQQLETTVEQKEVLEKNLQKTPESNQESTEETTRPTELVETPQEKKPEEEIKPICQNECFQVGLKRCYNLGNFSYQTCGDYNKDGCLEWSSTTLCPSDTIICQNGNCIQQEQKEQKCQDGTLYNQCSTNKPSYCENGNLINKCSTCGCPSGQQCQSNGSCVISTPTPSLTIISPNGGEQIKFYQTFDITWKSSGVNNAHIYLYFPDGGTCKIADVSAAQGKYSAVVMSGEQCNNASRQIVAGQYKILITTENENIKDSSDNYFNIVSSVTSCSKSDGGNNYYLKGKVAGYYLGNYLEDYDYCYYWDRPVDSCFGMSCALYEYYCKSDNTVEKISYLCSFGCEKGACIKPTNTPSFTVISPNGGERWKIGNNYTIKWENLGSIRIVGADLYKGGVFLANIMGISASKTQPAPTSMGWAISSTLFTNLGTPLQSGDDYKIRVRDAEGNIYDESDSYFSIIAPTQVISPNGGEKWEIGKTYDITWSSLGFDVAEIDLVNYEGGKEVHRLIVQNLPYILESSKYSWTIPTDINPGDSYKIFLKSSRYYDTNFTKESDNYFSITP